MSAGGTQQARRPSVSGSRTVSSPSPRTGSTNLARRCDADRVRTRVHGRSGCDIRGRASRPRLRERARSPTPAGLTGSSSPTRASLAPGGQAGTATLRRVRAAEKPPRAPGRLVYQPAPEERVESVDAAHLAVNACANAPIGGVGSCARVPPVRRRGEAAPLGRAWLGWGSCLEDRASGASAVPPDPKVDDRASAFLPRLGGKAWVCD